MQRIGVTGDMIYGVAHSEDRGGMMTKERSDMVIMVMLPTQLLIARN